MRESREIYTDMGYDKIRISDFSKNEFGNFEFNLKNILFFVYSEFGIFEFTFVQIGNSNFIRSHISVNSFQFLYSGIFFT